MKKNKKKQAGRALLIDGDVTVFRAGAATEVETQWGDWMWTLHCDFNAARSHLESWLDRLCDGMRTERVIFALTSPTNFRKHVMPTYKANRIGKRKPVCHHALREYLKSEYETYEFAGLEGDDALGVLATGCVQLGIAEEGDYAPVIVSVDKDMKTIPGPYLNDVKAFDADYMSSCIQIISEDEANYWHLYQTLVGDTSDGYKGCPGIGDVGATKLLHATELWGEDNASFDVPAAWAVVVAAYAKAGLSEDVALQNARVARILRYHEYDMEKEQVKLWCPK